MTVTIDIAVILGILYVSIMGIIIKILIQRDKKIKLKKYEIDLTYGTDTRVETQLDYIIDSVFDEYRLFNLEFRDNAYIKEADENKSKEIYDKYILTSIFIFFITIKEMPKTMRRRNSKIFKNNFYIYA